jgi:hypothetical protein
MQWGRACEETRTKRAGVSSAAVATSCPNPSGRWFFRCACRRSRPGIEAWFSSAHRRGLIVIEGFPVGACFDPDRRSQQAVLRAVDARAGEPLLEVLDPLEAGIRVRRSGNERSASAIDSAAPHRGRPLHRLSVPARVHLRCPIAHYLATNRALPVHGLRGGRRTVLNRTDIW